MVVPKKLRWKDKCIKVGTVLEKNQNEQYFPKNQYGLVPVRKKNEYKFEENNLTKKAITCEKKIVTHEYFFCNLFRIF